MTAVNPEWFNKTNQPNRRSYAHLKPQQTTYTGLKFCTCDAATHPSESGSLPKPLRNPFESTVFNCFCLVNFPHFLSIPPDFHFAVFCCSRALKILVHVYHINWLRLLNFSANCYSIVFIVNMQLTSLNLNVTG